MKAASYEVTGTARDALRVGERPAPHPGPGEVRVRLAYSGVNLVDLKRRAGLFGPVQFPFVIPHDDGAGEIDAVGHGVAAARVGERVYVYNAQVVRDSVYRQYGTAAEFTCVPAAQAVALPAATPFELGASLGVNAMTAHRALFSDGPVDGRVVLIAGGAGGVGRAAIQLAKWAGARVIATVGDDRQRALATRLGADVVLPFREPGLPAMLRDASGGDGFDRIVEVECGANVAMDAALLKPNGTIAAYSSDADAYPKLPFWELAFVAANVRVLSVYILPEAARAAAIRDVHAALEAGALVEPVATTFPLDRIAEAHEAAADKPRGKVLVQID